MTNLRIGFIGCGRHAKANIYPSLKLLGQEITAICAQHLEHAASMTKEFNSAKAYDDYLSMLQKEHLDAVFVMTSGEQHSKIVEDCLSAGAHVFVEKPLGLNVAEAKHVAAVSQKTGKYVMVGFMKRFAPAYFEMKKISQKSDSFGELLSLTGTLGLGSRGTGDDNYIRNMAIHYVDLLRFFLGEVTLVNGFKNSKAEFIDQVFCFKTEKGQIGNMFFAGLPSWERHWEEITLTGTKGFVKVENVSKLTFHLHQGNPTKLPRWQTIDEADQIMTPVSTTSSGGSKDLFINGFVGEVEHFLNSVAHNQAPFPSAQDNVKTTTLCDEILNSLKAV